VAPGRVSIEWQFVDIPGASVEVERMEDGAGWRRSGTALPDARGRVVWRDDDVRPGWRYAYRLRITSAFGEEAAGMIRVSIPGAVAIDLRGGHPNPARSSEVAIWFSLPGITPATLAIHDLRGRVVYRRELPSPIAGPQVVRPGTSFAAGIYFLEVRQGSLRASRKLTILH
jgi:hypothetical protein